MSKEISWDRPEADISPLSATEPDRDPCWACSISRSLELSDVVWMNRNSVVDTEKIAMTSLSLRQTIKKRKEVDIL
jgi:hypothetical protein